MGKKVKKNHLNIVNQIDDILFNYFNGRLKGAFSYDILPGEAVDIDLTQTSYNLDFKVSTYQSKSENIYFYISLFDYETKKEYNAGYFYIKNYTGVIDKESCLALYEIISEGNNITESIFWDYQKAKEAILNG